MNGQVGRVRKSSSSRFGKAKGFFVCELIVPPKVHDECSLCFCFFVFGYLSGLASLFDLDHAASQRCGCTRFRFRSCHNHQHDPAAGFWGGSAGPDFDINQGFIPVWLAIHYAPSIWITPLTAACVVHRTLLAGLRSISRRQWIGLCRRRIIGCKPPILPNFGRPIDCARLITRPPARASVFIGIVSAPALWLFGLRNIEFWIAVAAGIVIAYRFLIDWNPRYPTNSGWIVKILTNNHFSHSRV